MAVDLMIVADVNDENNPKIRFQDRGVGQRLDTSGASTQTTGREGVTCGPIPLRLI